MIQHFSAEADVTTADLDPSFLSQSTNAFHPLFLNQQQQQQVSTTPGTAQVKVKH